MNSSMKNNSVKKTQVLAVAVALALTTAAGFAQVKQAAPDRMKQHAQLDANKDGVIDRTEAAKAPKLLERFDQLDKNKDGKLSADERPQMGGKHRRGAMGGGQAKMKAMDTDNDGRISRAEAQAGQARMAERFDQMDVNKDGYLDKADMQASQAKRRAEFFEAADANHDGVLSRAEFDAYKGEGRGMGRWHGMGDAKGHAPKP